MPPASPLLRRRRALGLTLAGLAACAAPHASAPPEPGGPGAWRRGPALPVPVQEIYPALHLGRIHLAGGFVAKGGEITGPTAAHHAFDPADPGAGWRPRAPLPAARHHPNLVSFAGALYAIGGFESPAADKVWVMQASAWRYDAAADAWTGAPALPAPNGESVTANLSGALHVAGGRQPRGQANAAWADHADTGAHFSLDGPDGAWTPASPLPTPRNSAAGAVIAGAWHVAGGRTVEGGNTGAHEVYDPGEDRWRAAAPMPQGQGGLAAAALGGRLYAFGGEYFDPAPGGVYAQGWAYDPAADAWSRLPDMPRPRHGLGAVAAQGEIHLIGGALEAGGSQTSAAVDVFRP